MLAVLLLLIAGQALPQLARADAAPTVGEKWPYHGVIFGAGEWTTTSAGLGTATSDAALRAAVLSGASTIRLIPTWYMDSPNTTRVYQALPTEAQGASS